MRKPGCDDKICVIVGTVTDDVRLLEVPKLKVWKSKTCPKALIRA